MGVFFFFTKIMIGFDLNYKIYQFEEKIMRTNHQKTSRVIMMSLAILIELLLQLLVGNIDHYSVGLVCLIRSLNRHVFI